MSRNENERGNNETGWYSLVPENPSCRNRPLHGASSNVIAADIVRRQVPDTERIKGPCARQLEQIHPMPCYIRETQTPYRAEQHLDELLVSSAVSSFITNLDLHRGSDMMRCPAPLIVGHRRVGGQLPELPYLARSWTTPHLLSKWTDGHPLCCWMAPCSEPVCFIPEPGYWGVAGNADLLLRSRRFIGSLFSACDLCSF